MTRWPGRSRQPQPWALPSRDTPRSCSTMEQCWWRGDGTPTITPWLPRRFTTQWRGTFSLTGSLNAPRGRCHRHVAGQWSGADCRDMSRYPIFLLQVRSSSSPLFFDATRLGVNYPFPRQSVRHCGRQPALCCHGNFCRQQHTDVGVGDVEFFRRRSCRSHE